MNRINAKRKMKNEKCRTLIFALCTLHFALFLSACVSFRAANQVQSGRNALLTGKPQVAQSHFESAAKIDPDFVYKFSPLQQSVWTYLGRAYYQTGNLDEAKEALRKAVAREEQDYLAKLYLGLALSQNGNRNRGLNQIEAGLTGIHDWLEYIDYHKLYGKYWDPDRKIRSEIKTNLAMISGRDIEWQQLIQRGEWIGMKLEEEIDLARRDEREERTQDGDDAEEP